LLTRDSSGDGRYASPLSATEAGLLYLRIASSAITRDPRALFYVPARIPRRQGDSGWGQCV